MSDDLAYSQQEIDRIRIALARKDIDYAGRIYDTRWLATLDALARERDEAVKALAQARRVLGEVVEIIPVHEDDPWVPSLILDHAEEAIAAIDALATRRGEGVA